MSAKKFTMHKEDKYKEEWYAYPFCIKEDGEIVLERIPLSIAEKVRDKLNELANDNQELKKTNLELYFQVKEKDEKIQDLESQLDKFPPKIRELWIQD